MDPFFGTNIIVNTFVVLLLEMSKQKRNKHPVIELPTGGWLSAQAGLVFCFEIGIDTYIVYTSQKHCLIYTLTLTTRSGSHYEIVTVK